MMIAIGIVGIVIFLVGSILTVTGFEAHDQAQVIPFPTKEREQDED